VDGERRCGRADFQRGAHARERQGGRVRAATIYTALREVADALAGYRKTSEQRAEQEQLVEALRASSRLSTQRYEGGIDNYLQVLDAQRNLFQGELDLARLRQLELSSLVQLYRALGGGWDPAALTTSTTD
jgi:multidrug efflux system outer membrane protein